MRGVCWFDTWQMWDSYGKYGTNTSFQVSNTDDTSPIQSLQNSWANGHFNRENDDQPTQQEILKPPLQFKSLSQLSMDEID